MLSRYKAIFQARANAVADQMQDPRASLDYSLTRLEGNRRQLGHSLIDMSSAKRRLENQRDQTAAAVARHAQQAKASVEAGRDDLARTALLRKQEAEARHAELKTNVENLDHQLTNLKQSQISLEGNIAAFRSRVEGLKSLYDSSQAQLRIREAQTGISEVLADVDNTIQRAEARIQKMQSRADAIDDLVAEGVLADVLEPGVDDADRVGAIERELARIGRSRAVDKELARLKAEMSA